MSRDTDSSSISIPCSRKDYLLAGNLVLNEVKDRLEIGSIRAHLGVPGLLALLDDKIRRFSATEDTNELLGLAVDALVVFTQQLKLYGSLEEYIVEAKVSPKTRRPSKKSKSNKRKSTVLPESSGPPVEGTIFLSPCPRCQEVATEAGPLTRDLPDQVCAECESQLPGGELDAEGYLKWIQAGS
tara:strand:- start:18187 stop:18738 length:552 start_codon:yes stop_codon:yes gene_type:complete